MYTDLWTLSARTSDATDAAEEILGMPVRLGVPQHITGLVDVVSNPIHSTGVGLLLVVVGLLVLLGLGAAFIIAGLLTRGHARYLADIATCLERLRAGESYEICLTTQIFIGQVRWLHARAAHRARLRDRTVTQ